jgi:hypothetical protein
VWQQACGHSVVAQSVLDPSDKPPAVAQLPGSVSVQEPSGMQHAWQSSKGGVKLSDRVVNVLAFPDWLVTVTATTLRMELAPEASAARQSEKQ